MPNAIWRGTISFGLVTIPVTLLPAESAASRLSFHLLDRQDLAPVRQKRVNSRTAEEVPWDRIVKGHEVSPGRWVVIEDGDLDVQTPFEFRNHLLRECFPGCSRVPSAETGC